MWAGMMDEWHFAPAGAGAVSGAASRGAGLAPPGAMWGRQPVAYSPVSDSPGPLLGRASPPPQGMMMDEDEAHMDAVPTLATHASGEASLQKQRRLATQVQKWRALLHRNPQDPLSNFWAEQVASLEARQVASLAPGGKRPRGEEVEDMEDGSVWGQQKRVAFPGLAPPPCGASPYDTAAYQFRR